MSEIREPVGALWMVRAASCLLPRHARTEWRREWEGEVRSRWVELHERNELTLAARAGLLLRTTGSWVDALRYREGRWTMRGFGDDVKGAARQLRRKPGYAAVVATTLAVGVGGSTAVFGVASDVLLEPFPYPEPDKVVAVESYSLDRVGFGGSVTYPNVADLAVNTVSFDGIGLIRWWMPALDDGDGASIVRGATVTANFFEILGVSAGQGRLFRPDEEGEGRPDVVVLSHSLWTSRFGADPDVVGRDVRLNDLPYVVIGVLAEDFEDPGLMGGPGSEPRLWRTVSSPPSEWPRSGRSWKGIARVRTEVGIVAAQGDISAAYAALAEEYPEANANRMVVIAPLREVVAGPSQGVLVTLLAAVGLLLLIACANLANLQICRFLDREGDIAVHRALGASKARIVNQGLAETLLLATAGGVLGVGIAVWLGGFAGRLNALLPRAVDGGVDARVLAFALATTVGCALLFGLLPSLRAASVGATAPGRDGGRTTTSGRRARTIRRGLVIGQLAMTMTLLVAAGLLGRSLQHLGGVDVGFDPRGAFQLEVHGSAFYDLTPEAAGTQWHDVMDGLRSIPGVEAAGAMDIVPLGGGYSCDGVGRSDRPPPAPGEGRCAEVRAIFPGTLEALGVELVRGRLISEDDAMDAEPVMVVDETTAEAFWPGEDPIGMGFYAHGRVAEVVGIVGSLLHFGPGESSRPMVYLPAAQEGWNGYNRGFDIVVRVDDRVSGNRLREAVHEVNGSIALGSVQPFEGLLDRNLAGPRFRTILMAAFGSIALLLASLGIAGTMAYSVSRRSRELGVRLALGANPSEVRQLVVREGTALVAAGVLLGVAGSAVVARLLESLLFDVGTRDPVVYLGAVALLVGGALFACYVPARRASRVDPTMALQSE
ncbi:MAG: ABC transporter permease [Gemmatimonadetes bacterium]|nr:ABC transporter permease [Gemmatimonadota bacterium]